MTIDQEYQDRSNFDLGTLTYKILQNDDYNSSLSKPFIPDQTSQNSLM